MTGDLGPVPPRRDGGRTRSRLAVIVLAIGVVAMAAVWVGFGGDRDGHRHGTEASAVLAGADPARPDPARPDPAGTDLAGTDPAGSDPAGVGPSAADPAGRSGESDPTGTIDPAAAGQSGAHEHAAQQPAAPAATTAPSAPDDPQAPAADRRQVSLAEAAGGAPDAVAPVVARLPAADQWVDADAAGVNEGTKEQAAGVALQAAPRVDPTQVLPAHGLTNGCVAGYGGGTACLPQTPPSHAGHGSGEDLSIYWTCAEARTLVPDGIAVDPTGGDRLGLDSDRDGIACGPGDR